MKKTESSFTARRCFLPPALITVLTVIMLALFPFSGLRAATLPLFDDFNSGKLDPFKWLGGETTVHFIENGQAIFEHDETLQGVMNALSFASPETIQSISTDVTLKTVACTDCSGIRARILGTFYNDGSPGAQVGSHVGDVLVAVNFMMNTSVNVGINKCTDSFCSAAGQVGLTGAYLGNATVGAAHNLSVSWDGGTRFSFQLDGGTPVILDTSADAPYYGLANKNFKDIGTNYDMGSGYVAVAFDNVTVNGSLYDDFESSVQFDPTRWQTDNFVRQVQDGKLLSRIWQNSAVPQTTSNHTILQSPESIRAISADVTIDEYDSVSASGLRARLYGTFYNDGTPGGQPGSTIGDVWSEIYIAGTLVEATVGRFAGPFYSQYQSLSGTISLGNVAPGTTHKLSLAWDGALFHFQLDDNLPVTFDPVTAGSPVAGPANSPFKGIGTRLDGVIYPGTITASFDNVRVGRNIAPPIFGTWKWPLNEVNSVTGAPLMTFYPDGYYFTWLKNSPTEEGYFGFGTYSHDGQTLVISSRFDQEVALTGEDTQGMDFPPNSRLNVPITGDVLTFKIVDPPMDLVFNRIVDENNPIVGTWTYDFSPAHTNTSVAGTSSLTFFPDGYWLWWLKPSAQEMGHVEYGTYTWNGASLNFEVLYDQELNLTGESTRGMDTLSNPLPLTVSGNIMTFVEAGVPYSLLRVSPVTELTNTDLGSDIVSEPTDPVTGTQPVSLTFSNVTQGGTTTLTTSDAGDPPPAGFQLGDPPLYYEIDTTAVFDGPVEVCIDYSGVTFGDESQLALNHFENETWVNVTTSLDMNADIICGLVSSFSPFAIFQAASAQTVVINIDPKDCRNEMLVSRNPHRGHLSLPLAIMGSDSLDVTAIDPESLRLAGVEPERHHKKGDVKVTIKDIRTRSLVTKTRRKGKPVDHCQVDKKDRIRDMQVRFDVNDLVVVLESELGRELEHGETLQLQLTGELFDGTGFTGQDRVLIKKAGKNRHHK
ncbi:MAG: hypothetical protein ABIK68_20095 [bacterium]